MSQYLGKYKLCIRCGSTPPANEWSKYCEECRHEMELLRIQKNNERVRNMKEL